MSMRQKKTITCPKCAHVQDYVVWQSLNGDLDPEAKQQLLDGTLFRFECSKCGQKIMVNYGMLYHDMSNKAMVFFVDKGSVDEALATMRDNEQRFGMGKAGYHQRIVTDQNALREKAIIFDQKLDDRVIEIIKLFCYPNAVKRAPDANIRSVYFMAADGKYSLEFIGDKSFSAELPAGMYERIKDGFEEQLNAAGDKEARIDSRWASEFLKG
ncbi:MAG: CpXC domain-containing protein [Clostridia bacterium]|nr:CpXC domain-containing protein [Clostridia bacterium]